MSKEFKFDAQNNGHVSLHPQISSSQNQQFHKPINISCT